MVGEVNKIIYNMLVSGRGVNLPDIGSLYVERQAARKIADNKMLSPRNVVNFTTQVQAPSLIDEITTIAGCEQTKSQDIYERWLAKTRIDNTLTIEGIGKLVDKSFIMDEEFNTTLNPNGSKVLVLRRKQSHLWLYILSAVCVIFALGMLAYIMWGGDTKTVETTQTMEVAITTEPTPVAAQDSLKTEALQHEGQTTPAAQTQTQTQTQATEYTFYVVMGVFKEEANAARAIEQVEKNIKDVTCTIRPFKDKHMVTIFGSNKRSDCSTFAKAYSDIYPNLWIYENK